MSGAPLQVVTRTQGNNRALKAGAVRPSGAQLEFVEVPVLVDAFRRMVRRLEFDVCEMSLVTYLCAREHGVRFTALPVFLVRGFHHGAIVVKSGGGIDRPKQLEGRRVGVNRGYTVTTGVWARGVLADEYGVDPTSITWVRTGDEHVAEYRFPANVEPSADDRPLLEQVASGALPAAVGLRAGAGTSTLIPDADEAGYTALRQRGHYPINHLVVVRDDVLAARPSLAEDLFAAFSESKQAYLADLYADRIAEPTDADRTYRRVHEITETDPLPYGVEPNRAALEEVVRHSLDQRILAAAPRVDDLFAAATRGLAG